jgi:hypothetical protein
VRLTDYLDELRVDYRRYGESPHVSDGWIGLECPFCGRGTGKYGCGVHLRTNRVSCWKCGGHYLSDTLAELTGQPIGRFRAELRGVELVRRGPEEVTGKLELPGGIEDLGPAHRRYLAGRGFDPDEIATRWKVQGIGIAAKLQWRLFIPVHREREVVSWTTRAISDEIAHTERYRGARRTQESIAKHRLLYGEDKALHSVVVVEGPFDVWKIGPGAVCTCGVGFSEAQVARISRFLVRAICFDNEPAAQRRARELADALSVFPGETYVVQLDAPDPATASDEEIRRLRKRFID